MIEPQQDIRERLAVLIDNSDGYRCAGAFGSMEDALFYMRPDAGEVVLVDLRLPGMPGVDGIKLLREQYPSLRVIALAAPDDEDRVVEALRAGACGYLPKKAAPAPLLEGLSAILSM